MSDKKTKVDCKLTTYGTDKAKAQALDDLSVPDPEQSVGSKIIKEAMEKDIEDESKSGNS